MANITKYNTPDAAVTLMTTDLNTLANGSRALGTTVYDNSTNLNLYGNFELVISSTSNMTANSGVSLYLIPSIDGTNYVEGTGANAPQPDLWYGDFIIPRAFNSFRLALMPGINAPLKQLPPFKFKPLILNSTGQAWLSANTLKIVAVNIQNNG